MFGRLFRSQAGDYGVRGTGLLNWKAPVGRPGVCDDALSILFAPFVQGRNELRMRPERSVVT